MLLRSAFVLACTTLVASIGSLGIKQGKLSITSPDGLSDASYTSVLLIPLCPQLIFCRLKEPTSLPSPIILGESSTLKLTFTVIDTTTGDGVFPQQAHLLFEDPKGVEDVTLPISVKDNGRASFTIVCHPSSSKIERNVSLTIVEHRQTPFSPTYNPRTPSPNPPPLLPLHPYPTLLPSRRTHSLFIHPGTSSSSST